MEQWFKKRKIAHIGRGRVTPEVVVGRTMEKVPRIKSLIIAIEWDDGSFAVDWSTMKTRDMVALARLMTLTADRCFFPLEMDIGDMSSVPPDPEEPEDNISDYSEEHN